MPAIATEVVSYNNKLIYIIDTNGDHHTTSRNFYDYMLAREKTPKKVIIHDTLKQLKEAIE